MNEHKRRTRSRESRKKQLFLRVGITVLTLAVLIFGGDVLLRFYTSSEAEGRRGGAGDGRAFLTHRHILRGSGLEVQVKSASGRKWIHRKREIIRLSMSGETTVRKPL